LRVRGAFRCGREICQETCRPNKITLEGKKPACLCENFSQAANDCIKTGEKVTDHASRATLKCNGEEGCAATACTNSFDELRRADSLRRERRSSLGADEVCYRCQRRRIAVVYYSLHQYYRSQYLSSGACLGICDAALCRQRSIWLRSRQAIRLRSVRLAARPTLQEQANYL